MRQPSLRTLGAAALGLALAACATDQPIAGPAGAPSMNVTGGTGVIISEIMPNPSAVADDVGEWLEIHNGGSAAVDLQGWRIASANDAVHVINQPLVVPAGGYVVLVRNADTLVNGGVRGDYSYAHQTFNLNNSNTDWLALRDPSGASVDSVAWGTASPPNGASRGVIDPAADNTVMSGSNWSTQTSVYGLGDRGTPGAANDGTAPPPPPPPPPGTGALIINEVLADPRAVADAAGEWFEVRNLSDSAVDMNGWTIASLNDAAHVISGSVVVPARGYAVLGRNADTLANGGVRLDYVYAGATTLNLANANDYLVIRDGLGVTVDSVVWSTTQTAGASRMVIDSAADNTDMGGANWRVAATDQTFGAGDRGTPGKHNGAVPDPQDPGEPGAVASVSVAINSPRLLPVGYTKPAFPTARDGAGSIVSPPPAYTWTSSNPAVAAVDSLGYISARSPGTALITATAPNGVAGSASLDVIPATASTGAVYRSHVEFGVPAVAGGILLSKPQFSAMYSETRGGPAWVSWNLNATQFGSVGRCDCFTSDQTLPSGVYRVFDFDYRGSGYDRGHMVQSESRTTTTQENAATFLLTNILPQAGENNQGPWLRFENHLNDLARQDGKEIYVVAGGEYSANPETLKGEGRVQIPEWTWKVAVVMDGGRGLADVHGTGDLRVLAVRMPNDTAGARGIRNHPWEMYETTVDEIEARTGLDLLAALPDGIERIVESGTRAPVAVTDGPYVGLEGAAVAFDASASSDPDGDALTFAWSFGDGTTGTGATPSHVYADDGTYAVRVIVSDVYGAADTAFTQVTVMNVAPTVAAFAGAQLLPGETYAAGGAFADPGADAWTATVDYGDGTGAQPLALAGNTFSLAHVYAAPGTYAVTVTVRDGDGGEGVRTATVTVLSGAQAVSSLLTQVQALATAGTLPNGSVSALSATLNAAAASLARGNETSARGQLGAFVNQVRALVSSGRLGAAEGDALTAAAERILRSLGG